MQQNGDIGGFEWVFQQRLTRLAAQGASVDDLNTLQQRGAQIAAALEAFRTQRRRLGDSGRFTAAGLREALAEEAATAAGVIRREQDMTMLDQHIAQVKGKLKPITPSDPASELLAFWRQMERRADLARVGLTVADPERGAILYDAIKFKMAYEDALRRGDTETQIAIEQWPLLTDHHPVDAALIQQGQAQRQAAVDPINSKKLRDLEQFKAFVEQSVADALLELREFLPGVDPIAEPAAGQRDLREGLSEG